MILKGSSIDKITFILVIFDLMFFPYIRPISASLSMLILPIWFSLRSKIILNDTDLKLCIISLSLIFISFILSFVYYSSGFILRNGSSGSNLSMLPNTIIIIYMLFYFIFFKNIILRYKFDISNYLIAYLIFIFILAAFFYYDPPLYFKLRSLWTMYDNVIEVSEFENAMFRFTSTLSEPNNLAAIVCSIMAYIFFTTSINYTRRFFLILICSFIVLATMSSSGLITLAILIGCLFIKEIFYDAKNKNILIINITSVTFIALIIFFFIIYFLETDVGRISSERVSSNSLDSRLDIWVKYFQIEKILSSILWGDGGLVIIENRVINPHNGHYHLIFSYGLIFYLIFLYLFFSDSLRTFSFSSIFFIPIAICFTINVGIYELRFAGIMALLVASYRNYISNMPTNKNQTKISTTSA